MNYISLFSGIGGFEYGIQTSNKAEHLQCLGYSEVDKYATSIYEAHYTNHTRLGDATRINTKELPNIDFLVAGFPCQAFSHAGKRRGFNDTRGTLFFEIARILKDKRPRYFLLENVRGLLSHEHGETFQRMLGILSDLGYHVQWQIYNSKNHGVPQERERVYIKGYLRSKCGAEVLSISKNGRKTDAHTEHGEDYEGILLATGKCTKDTLYSEEGCSPTLCSTHHKQPIQIARKVQVRKYPLREDEIRELLRRAKEEKQLTTQEISEQLGIPQTEVEHWFRNDQYFSVPNREVWQQLKQLLGINTDEYDKEIMEYIIRDGVYEMDKRAYSVESPAPSLCTNPSLVQLNETKHQRKRIFSTDGVSTTLTANGGGWGAKTGLYQVAYPRYDEESIMLKNNTKQGYLPARCGDGVVLDFENAKGRVQKQKTPTLTAHSNVGTVTNELLVRRLTPLECERLQAFPDHWTRYGAEGEEISDTQRYKCLGNAVTTTVVRDILNSWEMIF